MATVDTQVVFDGDRRRIYHVTVNGADDATEQSLADISGITGPDEQTGTGYLVLEEVTWAMNDGYDRIVLYYHDEGNDEIIIDMPSGNGYENRSGYGAGTVDIEAATKTEDDYDILFDVKENGDENDESAATMVLSFRKRLTHL